ncbi:putative multidrug resistance ABC transporter ATP-binding/permease protein YheI [Dyadobacter sp. CECT 9275]|uniref:Multidrug resistance ABC transporter ATP-binding/permease protein YheI n=1 Tax=Dyadobacter helix TaxID=2822344 RepID=A0A916JDR3_9BACT|nr:ABC transporter ATP-binding protein [Dyadobacter sp. CECT 9275]CAG5003985.1 putative multidrug resistance ABC transporter ATP-binding/permease protein YheI [Dyadobacter sp. CECT 9275]
MKALKYLNQYLWKYKWYLILGTLFTIISNLFGIIPAQLVRYALDLVIETVDIYYLFNGTGLQSQMYDIFAFSILLYGLLILGMALLKGIFLFLVRQTIIVMSRHIEFDLKNDVYRHYQTLPTSFFRKHNTGDLMARISEDVSNVRMYVGPALMYGINLIVLFFLVISYMLTVSTKLTAYVLLPLPVLSVSVYVVNNMIMKRSQEIQKQLSGLSTYVQEAFSGIRVIKSFVQEKHSFDNFEKEAENFKRKSLKLTRVDSFFYPIILLLIGLSNILIIYIGGQEIINGNLTPGNITEFILYVNILTWPVMALGWTTSQIQRAASSQARINEFLNEKTTLVSEKNLIKSLEGGITFRNIGFIYPDSGIQALKHFDLEVKQGESVAILGTTGSGKSTLAHLLCRLYDPTSGEILIDGIPLKDYDVHAYRRQIGYVPQDVFLFSDSIRNNVRFGSSDMPMERIEQAVKDADLYRNIQDFPQGFDTVLGERGITLSGGQKQRLSIARAIARDPRILILDDCLSAVDTHTENIILNNLKRIMDHRTSVIISHRVSSAKLADTIVVLSDGAIIEKGTHAELMGNNGAYRELYEKQLVAEEI